MRFLAAVLTIGFIGIAVFGAFEMNKGSDNHSCIAEAVWGFDCPYKEDALLFINFHFDALKSFTTAIFSENIANNLILAAVLILTAVLGGFARFQFSPAFLKIQKKQFFELSLFLSQREFIRWLAFHENSPAVF